MQPHIKFDVFEVALCSLKDLMSLGLQYHVCYLEEVAIVLHYRFDVCEVAILRLLLLMRLQYVVLQMSLRLRYVVCCLE